MTALPPLPPTAAAPLNPQASLAARLRGWKDEASGLEQRLKDLDTFARSHHRRWWIAVGVFLLGLFGWGVGVVRTRPTTMVAGLGVGLIVNALVGMINERGWYRWWLIYVLALLDVLLVVLLIVWFGHGALIVTLFIAVLPYAFDQGKGVGEFLILVASLAYLGASYLHGILYPADAGQSTAIGLETVVFIVVAMTLKQIPALLIERIRQARGVMGEAEQGFLAVRASAAESDAGRDQCHDLDGAAGSRRGGGVRRGAGGIGRAAPRHV